MMSRIGLTNLFFLPGQHTLTPLEQLCLSLKPLDQLLKSAMLFRITTLPKMLVHSSSVNPMKTSYLPEQEENILTFRLGTPQNFRQDSSGVYSLLRITWLFCSQYRWKRKGLRPRNRIVEEQIFRDLNQTRPTFLSCFGECSFHSEQPSERAPYFSVNELLFVLLNERLTWPTLGRLLLSTRLTCVLPLQMFRPGEQSFV